ncbi:hypothetical protein D1872_287210 [compost metagenome]
MAQRRRSMHVVHRNDKGRAGERIAASEVGHEPGHPVFEDANAGLVVAAPTVRDAAFLLA